MTEAQQETMGNAESYLPFVRKIAGRIARRLPQSVELDDLVNAGTVGLMEALDRYDPAGGRRFETYAEFRVKGAILDELRRNDPLNRAARIARNQLEDTAEKLTGQYGRPPENEEMAAALNTSLAEFVGKLSTMRDIRVVPIEVAAMQAPSRQPTQEDLLTYKELVGLTKRAVAKLNRRQQIVLNLYYVEELTQAQIGEVLGVTESRVCQILTEIVKRIRTVVDRERVS